MARTRTLHPHPTSAFAPCARARSCGMRRSPIALRPAPAKAAAWQTASTHSRKSAYPLPSYPRRGWFYPFHYAPMARDLTRLGEHVVDLSYGRPFRPFEQLLAVLPAASGPLLPAPFRKLMTDPHSPILDFYPADFRLDNEGKRNEWEGVVLVPFIDEARLLQAVASVDVSSLSKAELDRNEMGFSWEFVYEATHAEEYPSSLPKVFSGLFPSR